jgi:hypothetical protein
MAYEVREDIKLVVDLGFKIWVFWLFITSLGALGVALSLWLPACVVITGWMPVLVALIVVLEWMLIRMPWLVGMFKRCDWARKLWLIRLVLSIPVPFIIDWLMGPESIFPSLRDYIITYALIGCGIAISVSRPCRHYMQSNAGSAWYTVAKGAYAVVAVLVLIAASGWFLGAKTSVSLVETPPAASMAVRLPQGWDTAEAAGFVIPVPVGSTNEIDTATDGGQFHVFREVRNGETSRYCAIRKYEVPYRHMHPRFGLDSLRKDYRFRFHHPSPHAVRAQGGKWVRLAGFYSYFKFDIMYIFNDRPGRHSAEIITEDADGSAFCELHIVSAAPLTTEERLGLVSRIRRVE